MFKIINLKHLLIFTMSNFDPLEKINAKIEPKRPKHLVYRLVDPWGNMFGRKYVFIYNIP